MKRGKASTISTERVVTRIFRRTGRVNPRGSGHFPFFPMIFCLPETQKFVTRDTTRVRPIHNFISAMVLLGRYRKISYLGHFPWSPWICLCDTQTCVTRGITWFWLPNTQKLLPIWFCLPDTQNPLLGTPQYNARNAPHYTLLWRRIVKERLRARAKPAVYPGQ